jgi:hypothetical protein
VAAVTSESELNNCHQVLAQVVVILHDKQPPAAKCFFCFVVSDGFFSLRHDYRGGGQGMRGWRTGKPSRGQVVGHQVLPAEGQPHGEGCALVQLAGYGNFSGVAFHELLHQ